MRRKVGVFYRKSYSQCGEDLIARYVFDVMRIDTPTFLDVGAHHPRFLSNTYLFYLQGSRGVNVEPDPCLFRPFRWWRWRDVNLNIGICEETGEMEFFVMEHRTLNTFSATEAAHYRDEGEKMVKSIPVRVDNINSVIKQNFEACPNFLSIDVEGLDFDILKTLDFSLYRPEIVCMETISFSKDGIGEKNLEIVEYLSRHGYMHYADTNVNGIFVDKQAWSNAFPCRG